METEAQLEAEPVSRVEPEYRCELKREYEYFERQSAGLIRSMKRLRRKMLGCERCEIMDRCEFRAAFNCAIDSVIEEISLEWGTYG